MRFWQALFFQSPSSDALENVKVAAGPFKTVARKSAEWNRGAYLVEAVLHCAECHSPRNSLGAPDPSRWMAGSEILFSGRTPPNITPDPDSGIMWSKRQWLAFLSSGIDPKGNSPGVEMALAVRATSQLTRADREAVVDYLQSLPAVRKFSRERAP